MQKKVKKIFKSSETYIALTVVALFALIQIQSGIFFTDVNLVDMLRAYIVPIMFACGTLVVIVSGGIDVSFPAVASLSIFLTTKILDDAGYTGTVLLPIVMTMVFGMLLEAVNGLIIAKTRLPGLIVTLGTQSVYWGILHGVFKASEIAMLPQSMADLSKANLFTVFNEEMNMGSALPVVLLFAVGVIILVWFVLNRTMIGRGIYAIGGDINSAERVGFNVFGLQMFVYIFMGAIAGLAGFTRVAIMSSFHPNAMTGIEMNMIAMVILGGARLSGGIGTVRGTVMGVILITTMQNSLQLLGIPTYWQKVFTGAIIIIGIGVSAYQLLRQKRKISGVVLDEK